MEIGEKGRIMKGMDAWIDEGRRDGDGEEGFESPRKRAGGRVLERGCVRKWNGY